MVVFFISLFKLVGESAPLPKPRKINASSLSASESLRTFKLSKITPPLAPPRTLSMKRDNANVLLNERINYEHVNKAYCSNSSIINDTSSLDEYTKATLGPGKTCSKLKNDCISFNEDQVNQHEKTLDTISNVTAKNNTFLKSSRYSNYELKSNFNVQNSMKLICVDSEEEAHSKFKDKFLNGDKFNQEKIPNISDNVENYKPLNSKEHTVLDSIKLIVSPTKLLSYEYNIIPKKDENNSLEQDYEKKFENIDSSCNKNENKCDNSLSESVTKLDCTTEPRSEQLKLLHHRFACQGLSNAQRETISESKRNVETVNPATCGAAKKSNSEEDKKMCTVISTIPKCERLDAVREDGALNNIAKCIIAENIDELYEEKHENYQSEESSSGARNAKRTRVVRSQSKSDDFQTDILKRQRRYLTLPPEDIAHALNLNVPARNPTSFDIAEKNQEQILMEHCIDRTGNAAIDKGESYGELITGACCCTTNFYFYPYCGNSSRRFLILLRYFQIRYTLHTQGAFLMIDHLY